jgi:hypothetical protein
MDCTWLDCRSRGLSLSVVITQLAPSLLRPPLPCCTTVPVISGRLPGAGRLAAVPLVPVIESRRASRRRPTARSSEEEKPPGKRLEREFLASVTSRAGFVPDGS